MPLPFIIGGLAIAAGSAGVGAGVYGGLSMKEANDTMKKAQLKQETAVKRFNEQNSTTTKVMDNLGKLEVEILSSFVEFSDIIEKIQNRPSFKELEISDVIIPKYEAEELRKVSVGAGMLLGSAGGATAGTFGGIAAAGVTTNAVMALGTASTGTAISSLSGAAATNATLAALGGGAIEAGGGGIALGTTVLGGATLGVGLLVGGVIFSLVGSKLSNKADEALAQAERTEKESNRVCNYLSVLTKEASRLRQALVKVNNRYCQEIKKLDQCVNQENKTDWNDFSEEEKLNLQNSVLLVGLLYKMCQTKVVQKKTKSEEYPPINSSEIVSVVDDSNKALKSI